MFNINKDYLGEEIGSGGTAINVSGVYNAHITEAKIWKSEQTQAESLNLKIENENGLIAWFNLFYKKKDGSDIDFNLRHITHLSYLLGTSDPHPDHKGHFKDFEDKFIGVFLTVKTTDLKDGGQGYQYNLDGFYDVNTRQTAKEKNENLKPEVHEKMLNKYKDALPVILNKSKKDDDFDRWVASTDNSDIPF